MVDAPDRAPYWDLAQWEDLRIVPGAFQFAGAADPDVSDWQPGGAGRIYKVYSFKTNDIVYFMVQIPHDYEEGTDIRAHLHWTPRNRGAIENGNTVAWKADYSWANSDAAFPSSGTVDLTDTCPGVDDAHLKTPTVAISGTGKEISSMLVFALYKDGGTWVGNAAGTPPAILEFDLHYERNTLGSNEELVKNA